MQKVIGVSVAFLVSFCLSCNSSENENEKKYPVDAFFLHELKTIDSLPENLRDKFALIRNTENQGAVRNQVEVIRRLKLENAIVMLLDGDDSLINDNTLFSYYNVLYDQNTEFVYGSCWSMVDNIPLISQPYPESVKQNKAYRQHHFNWILPYTHLRTFKKYLIKDRKSVV